MHEWPMAPKLNTHAMRSTSICLSLGLLVLACANHSTIVCCRSRDRPFEVVSQLEELCIVCNNGMCWPDSLGTSTNDVRGPRAACESLSNLLPRANVLVCSEDDHEWLRQSTSQTQRRRRDCALDAMHRCFLPGEHMLWSARPPHFCHGSVRPDSAFLLQGCSKLGIWQQFIPPRPIGRNFVARLQTGTRRPRGLQTSPGRRLSPGGNR